MKLLLLALGALVANGCSILPGTVAPTLEEMIEAATVVAYGEVTGYAKGDGVPIGPPTPTPPGTPPILTLNPVNTADIIFEVKTYYKGDGGCNLVVEGFTGTSLCGAGIPNVGSKIVIFSCGKM